MFLDVIFDPKLTYEPQMRLTADSISKKVGLKPRWREIYWDIALINEFVQLIFLTLF